VQPGPTCFRGDRPRYRSDDAVSTFWSGPSRSVPSVRTVSGGGYSTLPPQRSPSTRRRWWRLRPRPRRT
jgi:hypothetical protein